MFIKKKVACAINLGSKYTGVIGMITLLMMIASCVQFSFISLFSGNVFLCVFFVGVQNAANVILLLMR